ncbi:MAG: mechanosensitive ion channel [Planctomycetota bacterium]
MRRFILFAFCATLLAPWLIAQEPPKPPAGPDALAQWLAKPLEGRARPTTKAEAGALQSEIAAALKALSEKPEETRTQLAALKTVLDEQMSLLQGLQQELPETAGGGPNGDGGEAATLGQQISASERRKRELQTRLDGLKDRTIRPRASDRIDAAREELKAAESARTLGRSQADLAATAVSARAQATARLQTEKTDVESKLVELEKERITTADAGGASYALDTVEEKIYRETLRKQYLELQGERYARDEASKILERRQQAANLARDVADLEFDVLKTEIERIEEELRKSLPPPEKRNSDDPVVKLQVERGAHAEWMQPLSDQIERWASFFDVKGNYVLLDQNSQETAATEKLRREDQEPTPSRSALERDLALSERRANEVSEAREDLTTWLDRVRDRSRGVRERREELLAQLEAAARNEKERKDASDQNLDAEAKRKRDELRKSREELKKAREDFLAELDRERDAIEDFRKRFGPRRADLAALDERIQKNIRAIKGRLRWSREDAQIDGDSVRRAVEDLRSGTKEIRRWPENLGRWSRAVFDAPGGRWRIGIAALLLIVALSLFRIVQRRLPKTIDWFEEQTERTAVGRTFRIIGHILRRTSLSFFFAVIMIGVPWISGFDRDTISVVAVLFLTPFLYRLGRVLLDVALAPDHAEGGLLPFDEELSRIVYRAGKILLNLAVLFVPIGILMAHFGYAGRNEGFVALWWLIYKVTTNAVILFTVFRPAVLKRLIRGDGVVATSVKTWIFVLYPVVVGAILFLITLTSLRYETAERFFRTLFLTTGGVLLAAFVLYRLLLRALVKNKDIDRRFNVDQFASEQEYFEAGRRQFNDRTIRLVIRVVMLVPTAFAIHELWDEVNTPLLDYELWGRVSVADVLWAVFTLVVMVALVRLSRGLINYVIAPYFQFEQGLRYTIATLTGYLVITIGLIAFLNTLEVQGEQIALVTSALVFGIGFGLQSIVKNFISGLILLIERPVRVGDRVEVGGNSGEVDKITLRATRVMTWDGVGIVIPNEELIGGTLINHSLGAPRLRTTLTFGVAYGSNLGQVREVVSNIVRGHGLVLKRPEPEVFFVGFGDSSLDFEVRFWTDLLTHRLRVASDLRFAIDAAFRKNDIEIPFPQRDVHMRIIRDDGQIEEVPMPDEPPEDLRMDEDEH